MPTKRYAAARMRSTSSGSFTHHTNGFANAVRRVDDLIEIAPRDRVVPRVKAVRNDARRRGC